MHTNQSDPPLLWMHLQTCYPWCTLPPNVINHNNAFLRVLSFLSFFLPPAQFPSRLQVTTCIKIKNQCWQSIRFVSLFIHSDSSLCRLPRCRYHSYRPDGHLYDAHCIYTMPNCHWLLHRQATHRVVQSNAGDGIHQGHHTWWICMASDARWSRGIHKCALTSTFRYVRKSLKGSDGAKSANGKIRYALFVKPSHAPLVITPKNEINWNFHMLVSCT